MTVFIEYIGFKVFTAFHDYEDIPYDILYDFPVDACLSKAISRLPTAERNPKPLCPMA